MTRLWLTLWFCVFAAMASAEVSCRDVEYQGNGYSVCIVDVAKADLRLFLYDREGVHFGHFRAVETHLDNSGKSLVFAMNAGMYHRDRSPVGHYVENGVELMHVVPGAGPGNFGLVPNGIYCINDTSAEVIETKAYLARPPACRFATQSGPMLVIDGELHPRFLKDSTSRHVRNGVGTTDDGKTSVFVISRNEVTFHEFGSLFRDALGLSQALYFDGSISRLFSPELGRDDFGRAMGPIVGVVAPQN